jgi:hypothetical protein
MSPSQKKILSNFTPTTQKGGEIFKVFTQYIHTAPFTSSAHIDMRIPRKEVVAGEIQVYLHRASLRVRAHTHAHTNVRRARIETHKPSRARHFVFVSLFGISSTLLSLTTGVASSVMYVCVTFSLSLSRSPSHFYNFAEAGCVKNMYIPPHTHGYIKWMVHTEKRGKAYT